MTCLLCTLFESSIRSTHLFYIFQTPTLNNLVPEVTFRLWKVPPIFSDHYVIIHHSISDDVTKQNQTKGYCYMATLKSVKILFCFVCRLHPHGYWNAYEMHSCTEVLMQMLKIPTHHYQVVWLVKNKNKSGIKYVKAVLKNTGFVYVINLFTFCY